MSLWPNVYLQDQFYVLSQVMPLWPNVYLQKDQFSVYGRFLLISVLLLKFLLLIIYVSVLITIYLYIQQKGVIDSRERIQVDYCVYGMCM